jgi:hypothetical protein
MKASRVLLAVVLALAVCSESKPQSSPTTTITVITTDNDFTNPVASYYTTTPKTAITSSKIMLALLTQFRQENLKRAEFKNYYLLRNSQFYNASKDMSSLDRGSSGYLVGVMFMVSIIGLLIYVNLCNKLCLKETCLFLAKYRACYCLKRFFIRTRKRTPGLASTASSSVACSNQNTEVVYCVVVESKSPSAAVVDEKPKRVESTLRQPKLTTQEFIRHKSQNYARQKKQSRSKPLKV